MRIPGLFITGTDTGVGKTYVAALIVRDLLARGIRTGAYKPVCTGSVPGPTGEPMWEDVRILSEALGGRFPADRICPQCFDAPLAPPVAARREERSVNSELLRAGAVWWQEQVDFLVVEGVGGLLCPLTQSETVADLAHDLGFPLLIVSRPGLGTINHTLLTAEVAHHRGLPIAGILLNEAEPPQNTEAERTNPAEIAVRCRTPVLGVMPYGGGEGGLLRDGRPFTIDWDGLTAATSKPPL